MNILVTGAGALLGQGILRCLRSSSKEYRIITADPDVLSSGHWLGDKAIIIPMAKSDNYISKIKEIIEKEKVDIVLIGTDVELPILSKYREELENQYPVKIVVAHENVISIGNDKWLTAEFLRLNNFPYPASALTTDAVAIQRLLSNCKFPFIAKPVDGARSKGLVIIKNQKELDEICAYKNNLVVQELLHDKDGEFTSGCIVFEGKCKAIVTLRRDLRDGNTFKTYRDHTTSQYDFIIMKVAEKLKIEGPCNFQFRVRDGQPVIFEINSRFSGTTPLRYFYGFNEVESVIDYLLNKKEIKAPNLREGIVLRTFSDIMIENTCAEGFRADHMLKNPGCKIFNFIP